MEESEFSSEFANQFLTWEDDDATGPSPAPSDGRDCEKSSSVAAGTATQQFSLGAGMMPSYMVAAGPPGVGSISAFSGHYQAAMGMMQPHYQTMMAHVTNASTQASMAHSANPPSSSGHDNNAQQHSGAGAPAPSQGVSSIGGLKAPQLHPLGIQSSAKCPPHGTLTSTQAQSTFLPIIYNPILQSVGHPNQHLIAMVQANQQAHHLHQVQQHHALHHAQVHQHHQVQQQQGQQQQQQAQQQQQQQQQGQQQQQHQQQQQEGQQQQGQQQQQVQQQQQIQQQKHVQQQQHQQHAQQPNPQQQLQQLAQPQQQAHHHYLAPPTAGVSQQHYVIASPATGDTQQFVTTSDHASLQQHFVAASSAQSQQSQKPAGLPKHVTVQHTTNKPMPPFYLFDAPCELRANFLASQRMHNIPISNDDNAFHYGMAVNGFHPQVNAQINPVLPLPGTTALPAGAVQLVDARSKKSSRSGKERNEREQKRAQKITELIEKLRVSMENGGWKVEMKSKFHTLSTCADYVTHLAKATKAKEAAVEKARHELEMKERKMEEEKNLLERSDPESVTSSLTAMTTESKSRGGNCKHRKRRPITDANTKKEKKAKTSCNDASSDESGSENGQADHTSALDKMSSSMSELTDSNKGSSESGDGAKTALDENKHRSTVHSISSTAAVARGAVNSHQEPEHADVVVKKKEKGKGEDEKGKELTSLDPDFELDFETVFVTSNVPQLIATPAGRIVASNNFFSVATGISSDEISRLTVFSIVRADKLSCMFEMVAEALRGDRQRQERQSQHLEEKSASSSNNTTSESGADSAENGRWEHQYAAITLPCVSFPSRTKPGSTHHPNPLYMTVTLLSDDDPRKRCFHCILTDHPGTKGKLGFITPELLAMMFSGQPDSSETNFTGLEESESDNLNTSCRNSSIDVEDGIAIEQANQTVNETCE